MFEIIFPTARSANAMTSSLIDSGVIRGEWVPVDTMRLLGVRACDTFPSSHVFPVCNWLKMERIDTGTISAQMVEFVPVRDCSDEEFIGESVSRNHAPVSVVKPSPPIPVVSSKPGPAPKRISTIDLLPESNDLRDGLSYKRKHGPARSLLFVMTVAETEGTGRLRTSIKSAISGSLGSSFHEVSSRGAAGRGDLAGGRCVRAQRPLLLREG